MFENICIDRQTDRQTEETIKYSQLKLPGTPSLRFVPLVMKRCGRWGEEANKYLQELSQRATDDSGKNNCKEFMCFWQKRFSTTLQWCNANTIAKKISILSSTNHNDIDVFVTQFYV